MKYFKESEFACKCCGVSKMQDSTTQMADAAREKAGIPFYINSGYRCEAHNRAVGGKQDSAHTKGYAFDVRINEDTKATILGALKTVGFKRIGIASNFIHVDNDPSLPSPANWVY